MCGIFGFIGRVPGERWGIVYDILTALAVETEERGQHATGYAAIDERNFITSKAPIAARAFVQTEAWRALAKAPQEVVIGHCRYATAGAPRVNENNHPHVGERFALVHNGVISGHKIIAAEQKVRVSTACDSEVLLRVIEKPKTAIKGIRRLFSGVLGGMQRSAACALLDKAAGTLHLFRTNERPLHVVRLPAFDDAVVFASTPEIIARALGRVLGKVDVSSDFSALPGRVYSFSLNGTARPNLDTCDMPAPVYVPSLNSGRLFDDMFSDARLSAFKPAPRKETWDTGWKTFHCTGCGDVISQRAHLSRDCYRCGSRLEEIEGPTKSCHDCARRVPEHGPSRCPRCAEKRRNLRRLGRAQRKAKGGLR